MTEFIEGKPCKHHGTTKRYAHGDKPCVQCDNERSARNRMTNSNYNNAINPEQVALLGKYKLVQATNKEGKVLGWALPGNKIVTAEALERIAVNNMLSLQIMTTSKFGIDVEPIVIN